MTKVELRKWFTVAEFRRIYPQIGRTLVYESIRNRRLPSVKIGGKILIPSDALDRLLEEQNETD